MVCMVAVPVGRLERSGRPRSWTQLDAVGFGHADCAKTLCAQVAMVFFRIGQGVHGGVYGWSRGFVTRIRELRVWNVRLAVETDAWPLETGAFVAPPFRAAPKNAHTQTKLLAQHKKPNTLRRLQLASRRRSLSSKSCRAGRRESELAYHSAQTTCTHAPGVLQTRRE